jgi:2-polyprenyl-3-methyl-5-hydroxy-6-metoxy-1,4-benzoquinol methylase
MTESCNLELAGGQAVTYRLFDEDPDPTTVAYLTFVPFLPDGRCVALPGPRLPDGEVRAGEHWLLDSSLRIPLETVAFRRQRVHPFAIDGDHVYLWLSGDHYSGQRAHATIDPVVDTPEAIAAQLPNGQVVLDAARAYRGQSDADYYAGNVRLLEPAYLRGTTPQQGSGFGGDEARWRSRRHMIVDAVDRAGTFLDVGCANGLLMESIQEWAAERGFAIEPYGVDLAPGLVAFAKQRLPHWADRIEQGNAIDYQPGRRFTFVHTLLDQVPTERRRDLINHQLRHVVEPGGRLIVSHYQSEGGTDKTAAELLDDLGFTIGGSSNGTAWIDN